MGSDATHHEHDGTADDRVSAQDGSYVDDDLQGAGRRTGGPHDGEADGTYTEEPGSSEGDGSYVDAQVPDEPVSAGGPHDGEADGSFTRSDLDGDG
jgi:hypothetical protein